MDDDNKVVAPGEQVISVTLGDRSAPTKLAFTKDGNKLVSDKAIPEGNDLPTVVQIKAKAGCQVRDREVQPQSRTVPDLQEQGIRLHLRAR